MALYGVLADIHGNLEALRAVLAALDARGVERLLCPGDLVGYNADPDECVALLRARPCEAIAGNHDLIALGRLGFERCSNKAAYSLRRTRRRLAPASAEYLGALPGTRLVEGRIALVHGGVRDVQQYMKTPALIAQNAEWLKADLPAARLCFFGHSHEQKVYEVDGSETRELAIAGKWVCLKQHLLYFVNPGSVDAQRKHGSRLAECAVLDSAAWKLQFLRVPYDAASAEAKAAVFGYRIGAFTERLYRLRRRLLAGAFAAFALALPAAARADWLSSSDPLAATLRPADGATVQQTPPDFSWPDVSRKARYTVNLTYPDGTTRSLAAPQNYLNWNEVLPPGRYRWTVSETGPEGRRTSGPRSFTVGRDAKPFLVPDMQALLARMKAKPHPRGLPDAATLAAMAKQRPRGTRELRADVSMRTRQALQSAPDTGSPSADEGRVLDEVKLALNALAAYALFREDVFFREALRHVNNMASWDPNGTTAYTRRGVDMGARSLTFALVLGYDWLYPKLDAPTRGRLLAAIRVRLGQMYDDVIGERSRIARQPRDSHGQVTATMVGMMSALLAGDLPEADRWMPGALPLALNLVQPWGGEDGGFSNGTPYAIWDTGTLQPVWYILRWATGIDLAQKAWVRNFASLLAYFNPPGTPVRLFGDGHEQSMFKEQSARFGKGYASFAPSPLARWYASQLSGEDAMRFEYIMAPPAGSSGAQPLPQGTPNAIEIASTGWVAMHSSLADPDRVSVYFKSSPPPYGAFAHQHADQNSFVVNAGGERLAIESGYYDGYKTPHWWNWLKQTRAANAITYDGGHGQIFFEATGYKKMGYGRITQFSTTPQYDYTTGDATRAYDGALTRALRSLVYLRPGYIVVHDKLASATPRRWEWNIHALHRMEERPGGKIRIRSGDQSLCVQMLAAPPLNFAQTDRWLVPAPLHGDSHVVSGAEPRRGAPQWHGRFSTEPLAAAEFVALLDVGCKGAPAGATRDDSGAWSVRIGGRVVSIGAGEAIRVR